MFHHQSIAAKSPAKTLKELLSQEKLHFSGVVANNQMNRERGCLGKNSYQKDLSFNPIDFLEKRLEGNQDVSWLDICCGTGKALIEAATIFADKYSDENLLSNLQITGIDLAGMFQEYSSKLNYLQLLETSVEDYQPGEQYDLVTSAHGLHYIGDKLGIIQKAVSWLKADGIFLANLDANNLKLAGKHNSIKSFSNFLRKQKLSFNNRKHLLSCQGKKEFKLPFAYLGANDQAGANYTGQSAVDSYYRIIAQGFEDS